jgi:hypothetical protein
VGSAIETETWQPRKVLDKINTNHTFPNATNYSASLDTIQEDDNTGHEEHINSISTSGEKKIQETLERAGNKWTHIRSTKRKRHEHKIIIDSGATSHFVSQELDLPNTGPSNKDVYLPDNTKRTTTNKTLLPFQQLTMAAREADILPGLKKSLASANK